jgi:alkylation response protein AidB-like acyl-CoA dehydrogenase
MARSRTASQASRELAEASRETRWQFPSVTAALFGGDLLWDVLSPFPAQGSADALVGDAYLAKLGAVLDEHVDADEIDRSGVYPPEALAALAEAGAFGMRVDAEYGGLGLSVSNYCRALSYVGSHCQSTMSYLSAHQSVGVPQPLKMFGTEEQRRRWLPRLAAGEISAFALTEPDVGSDPARMTTTATLTADGSAWVLDGRKLWTTNVPDARILVVLAKTPPKNVKGREIPQITAFVVESDMPGYTVEHRCSFMGLRGIANGVVHFDNVRVPAENVIGKPGEGLRIALSTLNVGRLGAAAAAVGGAKVASTWVEKWANERVQWGAPIGRHQTISRLVANVAANTFAMDAIVTLVAALADKGQADIRLEASIAKLFCTETAWRLADDVVQIRGGRGYETAESLRGRGEEPMAVERMLRDARIGRILEGSSEIMHLLIAREALDGHLRRLMPLLEPKSTKDAASSLREAAGYYAKWYPKLWTRPRPYGRAPHLSATNAAHLRYVQDSSHRMARELFHTMAKYRQRLEKEQIVLANFVDIGVDLFAMAATLAFAEHRLATHRGDGGPQELADLFCANARERIEANFRAVHSNHNRSYERVAASFMDGRFRWLEEGVYQPVALNADPEAHAANRV